MDKKLLIIGFVWPEPNSSAAGVRLLQLLEVFQDFGYVVSFASSAKKTEKSFDLNSINVSTYSIQLNNSSFDSFIKNLSPSVVLYDRFMTEEQFGWRVRSVLPNTLNILDTEDFHGLRKARALALKNNDELNKTYLQNDTTIREIASIYRCDLSLIISEIEYQILLSEFKVDPSLLIYLPFLIDTESLNVFQNKTFEERSHFMTIGNFIHPPNYDAVLHLKKDIWPLIRKKIPKSELHIYGAYASQKVTQLHNKNEGFIIKGFTENVKETMNNYKVCLAPLRFGAGLKGKILDAMLYGLPSVMSPIAIEGMFGDNKLNGYVSNNQNQFSEFAITLYNNKQLWNEFRDNGYYNLKDRFSKTHWSKQFYDRLITILKNFETHRLNNFTGKMLQHHTLQSTKFMSKWIEEKNK